MSVSDAATAITGIEAASTKLNRIGFRATISLIGIGNKIAVYPFARGFRPGYKCRPVIAAAGGS